MRRAGRRCCSSPPSSVRASSTSPRSRSSSRWPDRKRRSMACSTCCARTASSRWSAPAAWRWRAASAADRPAPDRRPAFRMPKRTSHTRYNAGCGTRLALRSSHPDVRQLRVTSLGGLGMPQIYYDRDADLSLIQKKTVAILGYGSQGHAHALNLHDSGVDVRVGLPASSRSRAKAQADGLAVTDPATAVSQAGGVRGAAPDTTQGALYRTAIEPNLKPGATL